MTKKITISIIEDNKMIRNNLSKYVGFTDDISVNIIAGSVEEYLNKIENVNEDDTDILVLDIGLPGMSGLEGIQPIRAKQPSTEIIMFTSFEEEDKILKAMCSGASAYISKKTSLEQIVEGIRIVHNGGSYMSPQIAREIFNYMMHSNTAAPVRPSLLSERQNEILVKLVDGKSYQKISEELDISIETVRTHIKKMYKVLQVSNKAEAITKYLRKEIN